MAAIITNLDPTDLTVNLYESMDVNLISTFDIDTSLIPQTNIELFIYDNNNNIISENYNFTNYAVLNDGPQTQDNSISTINIEPDKILTDLGYEQGEYKLYFNILDKKIGNIDQNLFISEISSDRTEIRLDSTSLSVEDIINQSNAFISERENSDYFIDFYLDFKSNNLLIANNISLDNQDPTNPTVLIKLYEALPSEITLNSLLWVATMIEEPKAYNVVFEDEIIAFNDTISIKSPNFNIDFKDQINNSTAQLSYIDLIASSTTSSQSQINSLLEESEIDINVDYSNFSNFIHFSSSETRLNNFFYKVELIENYSSSIALLSNVNSSSLLTDDNINILEGKIDNIITNFDGYEYELYFTSSSYAWPKTNTLPPYTLAKSNSTEVYNWFGETNEYSPYYGGMILSASLFDDGNKDLLLNSIPSYLRNDEDNRPYELFIDMVAQHFDNIWVYYKDVSQKYNADNRLEYGISRDLVADAIRDFGIKLYQNNFSNNDLYTAFLGMTPDGGLFPFPNITGSLPTPTGFEYINTFVSSSNDILPLDDVNKSIYKRIYHNLPYLLKSKGTLPGLRALITSYGIPDTILRINEFGGQDKNNSKDWDYWKNEFNYAFNTQGTNFISSSWGVNTGWNATSNKPSSVEFRILPQTPTSHITQSIWNTNSGSALTLTYTSSLVSGSYSGSILDVESNYGILTFYPQTSSFNTSASIYLPLFNGSWWSVLINKEGNDFTLYAKQNSYEGGYNNTKIGFEYSASITGVSTGWVSSSNSYFATSSVINSIQNNKFDGKIQEIRYYKEALDEYSFDNYVMNPHSILCGENNELIFRASLGGELYTGSNSIHPKVTGSWSTTSSFPSGNSFYYNTTPVFDNNSEYFFYDQPSIGIRNPISDKIRLEDNVLPPGDTLSSFRRITQNSNASASYSSNINLLEVAFSPQNEINDDINNQLGYFNIGEYIGDPRYRTSGSTSYADLDKIRSDYFEKYTKNYNLYDFINLIKYFDNSLFKMIRDFIPARTSLASGIVIKQNLLERNRIPQTLITQENNGELSSSFLSQWSGFKDTTLVRAVGGTGGTLDPFNSLKLSPSGSKGLGPDNMYGITQSWQETKQTLSGSTLIIHNDQVEFYNGEWDGSVLTVATQSLHPPIQQNIDPLKYDIVIYNPFNFNTGYTPTGDDFLKQASTIPLSGNLMMSVSSHPSSFGVPTIKINKIDKLGIDRTIPLSQIDNIIISLPLGYKTYYINSTTEFSEYYLYSILPNSDSPSLPFNTSNTNILDYRVQGTMPTKLFKNGSHILLFTASLNPNNFYNSSSGLYSVSYNPNISLTYSMSFDITAIGNIEVQSVLGITGSYTGGTFPFREVTRSLAYPVLDTQTQSITMSGELTNISNFVGYERNLFFRFDVGDYYFDFTGTASMANLNIQIQQKNSSQTILPRDVLVSPYITEPNYTYSNINPLLNNVSEQQTSKLFYDVDYSEGIISPQNFQAIISGSASFANVQNSNYSSKKVTLPRYEGSKSTTKEINIWDEIESVGTYGKLPSIESLKTFVAYVEGISGWPPERMNSSAARVKYLINQFGEVITPNVSPFSLETLQQTFLSGERLILAPLNTVTVNTADKIRNIIKGGSTIKAITYNQISHTDNLSFAPSITFIENSPDPTSIIPPDVTATLSAPSPGPTSIAYESPTQIEFPTIVSSGVDIGTALSEPNGYKIIADALTFNDIIFNIDIEIINSSAATPTFAQIDIYINASIYDTISTLIPTGTTDVYNFAFSIPILNLALDDVITFEIQGTGLTTIMDYTSNTILSISTNPPPTKSVLANSFFTSDNVTGTMGNNEIAITNTTLFGIYGNNEYKQQDISGSGVNPITELFSFLPCDEIKFEGNEEKTYTIIEATKKYDPEPYIEIKLDKDIINRTGNFPLVNITEFLVRRYTNDPTQIIIEGYRIPGADGRYIVKPEFVVPELDKSTSEYILLLTEKGLI
jgi:hypothetical protein